MFYPVAGHQLLHRRLFHTKQRVLVPTENADLLAVEGMVGQGRQRAAEIGNRHVQLPIDHRQFKLRGRIHENMQMHVVFALVKACDRGIDARRRQGGDIVGQAQV
ncbi:hypothetical protein D3C81_1672080 [compost metagenome]